MVTGAVPFRAKNMRDLRSAIFKADFKFPPVNPRSKQDYSAKLQDLVGKMFNVDP